MGGPDLIIGLAGTGDRVTATEWFGGGGRIDAIHAGSITLSETGLERLIGAMARVCVPAGQGGSWTGRQSEALAGELGRCWVSSEPAR
jgi:hypothetical protein